MIGNYNSITLLNLKSLNLLDTTAKRQKQSCDKLFVQVVKTFT